jgi:voltage-gated potassium channel Kch
MKDPTFRERLQYWFDRTMTKGALSQTGWLALIAVLVALIASLIVWGIGLGSQTNLGEQVWEFFLVMLQTSAPKAGPWGFRLANLAIVFTSIFVLSTLIGIIATGIDIKLEELRKGRSKVIEKNHTVILGWSPQIFQIISELVAANQNRKNACIVVLADQDKVQMQDEIGDTGKTRLVCRRGDPMKMADLELVSLNTSKSIIILSPRDENPDVAVIKILLAISKHQQRRTEPYHIVAQIHEDKNYQVAKLISGAEVELVSNRSFIGRIAAQACRQSGLSIVYQELLNFAGDEIYIKEDPGLIGKTYREATFMYEDSAVIGLKPADGSPIINPGMETLINKGDQIIAVSKDDDTVIPSRLADYAIQGDVIHTSTASRPPVENTLILGWNKLAWTIICELDNYVPGGSKVDLVSREEIPSEYQDRFQELEHLTCSTIQGDTTDRETLERLDLDRYHHVILLPYSDALPSQEADAITLISLLHLRDLANIHGYRFSIVSELLDIQNQELAEAAKSDDFIVSERLISLIMVQISENKNLSPVFGDLFAPTGSEIYLKPVGDYLDIAGEVNFYSLLEAASRKGETAIGYRINKLAYSHEAAHGIKINPQKSQRVQFSESDRLIVLARE